MKHLETNMAPEPPWDQYSESNSYEKGQPSKPRTKCCGCIPTAHHVKSWSTKKKVAMAAAVILPILALAVGLSVGLTVGKSDSSSPSSTPVDNSTWAGPPSSDGVNRTANTDVLTTWWHDTGEVNPRSMISNENVRQSHLYSVQVASKSSSDDFFNSFVYETIPRSGKGQACHPDDITAVCSGEDGITIEADIGVTMAWSQFLYGEDTIVKVSKRDNSSIDASNVTIRPTTLDYAVRESNGSLLITVPYTPDTHGTRFSVEFGDDTWEYRNAGGLNQSYYVQNVNSTGKDYVSSYNPSMPVVGREPMNSLLIFASPMPAGDLIPTSDSDAHEVPTGLIENLDTITNSIVVFKPGVYYSTGMAHMNLSSSVNWVYFAPGSYVKGAVEYNNAKDPLKATGYGVLSGEQYVYQANMAQGYSNNKSDENSVKMWRGRGVTATQSWTLNGVTMNAPPFNSMDFYGETDNFTVDVSDYKQVGSFFTQTDGLQMYPNSHVRDIFYHTGDDTIKTYYSNIKAERIVVWKTNNGPVVQLGWAPRNINNVTLDQIDVIHSRYNSKLDYAPRALIGSSSSYTNITANDTANLAATISDYRVYNIRGEGISPNLISLNMLSNYDGMIVENPWIEELTPSEVGISTSTIVGFTNPYGQQVSMGGDSSDYGLSLKNYSVGTDKISFSLDNWISSDLGGFWVDSSFGGKWKIE